MMRAPISLLLSCLAMTLCACVDPPSVDACREEAARRVCGGEDIDAYRGCCDVVDRQIRLQGVTLTDAQGQYVEECVRQFITPAGERRCLESAPSMAEIETWDTIRAIRKCVEVSNDIEGLNESNREDLFIAPCVEAVMDAKFPTSHARDPFALILFCSEGVSALTQEYAVECLTSLSQFVWFPGTVDEAGAEASLSETVWEKRHNVPRLCRRMENPGLCSGGPTGAPVCINKLQQIKPASPERESNFFGEVEMLEFEGDTPGYSCKVCAQEGGCVAREEVGSVNCLLDNDNLSNVSKCTSATAGVDAGEEP